MNNNVNILILIIGLIILNILIFNLKINRELIKIETSDNDEVKKIEKIKYNS